MHQDEIEALLESYEAAPARIAAAAVGHGERLAEPPAPGEWSPRDVLAHVRAADPHTNAYIYPNTHRYPYGHTTGSQATASSSHSPPLSAVLPGG